VKRLEFDGAILSDDGVYRYRLWRTVAKALRRGEIQAGTGAPERIVAWIMLNPSTADALVDDATIRRLRGFTLHWGFDSFDVVNLYGLRSKNPKKLWAVRDPIGPENDGWVREVCSMAELIVCAWGVNAGAKRVEQVLRKVTSLTRPVPDSTVTKNVELYHLGLTQDGIPRHPLRLPKDLHPENWVPICDACLVPSRHTHCAECGSYDHAAENCDNGG
jgi:hypothetical protein